MTKNLKIQRLGKEPASAKTSWPNEEKYRKSRTMRFIDRIIGPDEKKIGIVTAHWIYGVRGLGWLISFIGLGWITNYYGIGYLAAYLGQGAVPALFTLSRYVTIITIAAGALIFLFYCTKMISTEIGLTDRRVMLKEGLIFVDVKEIDIDEIKAANVNNGVFGRFLNYGYIFLDSRFVQNIQLIAIGDPYRFVKALNEARTRRQDESLRLVLDEKGAAVKSYLESKTRPRSDAPHVLDEPRYYATEHNPLKALSSVAAETKDNLKGKRASSDALRKGRRRSDR